MKPTLLTPELAASLTRLWEAGETGVYIERRLGVTRDVIARFVRELGLTPRNVASPWSDARVELLKKLWQEGLSASQIAKQLGGVTRNAVIAKANRLGLKVDDPATTRSLSKHNRKAPKKPRGHKPDQAHAWAIRPPELRPAPAQPKASAWESLPGAKPVPLSELVSMHCRWPIVVAGSEEPMFCGCLALGSYCEAHAKRAYSPTAVKARVDQRLGLKRRAA
jgi:GcrA cell cycle regulator